MTSSRSELIELTEYQARLLPRDRMPDQVGRLLWENYRHQVEVDFPNPATGDQWRLMPQGWIGHIPLTPEFHLALQPKVGLANLFQMLDYAYRLKSFHLLPDLVECRSLADFYERLASILARRISDRARNGLHRQYLAEMDRLPYLRGRLDIHSSARRPGQINLDCRYENQTTDIEDNQILAWTLSTIARSGVCSERVLPVVRRAYRTLQGTVSLTPYRAEACVGRLYDRLNDDYQPMHALCRFFLEQSGPSHQLGERTMLPFLVNMARLYELFVAEWLKLHLPDNIFPAIQERVKLSGSNAFHFDIDLVLYETGSNRAACVLDTKYKTADKPDPADIFQVVAYAKLKRCREAILIYPTALRQPLDTMWDDIRVRSLTFGLDGDLEQAGEAFIDSIGLVGTGSR